MQVATVDDPIDVIKMLMEVSESVSEYIRNQHFLLDSELGIDGVDPAGVAVQCYRILIEELARKGVYLHTDEDLLSNWLDAERIYHLHQWLDTATQIEIVKTHPDLLPILETIISNEITESTILSEWVSAVKSKTPMDVHILAIEDLLEDIEVTTDFKDLLEYVFKQTQFTTSEFRQPIETIINFVNFIADKQAKVTTALNILRKHIGSESAIIQEIIDKQLSKMDNYDVVKLQPEVVSDYAWAWTIEEKKADITEEDLPDSLKKKFKGLEEYHHSTTNHHPEYYLTNRDKQFDTNALILVLTAVYEPQDLEKTKEEMDKVLAMLDDRIPQELMTLSGSIVKLLSTIGAA